MSALEELFLEVEKHAVLRGHATLVSEARNEYQGSKYLKMVDEVIKLHKELARLRKIEAALKSIVAEIDKNDYEVISMLVIESIAREALGETE